MRLLSRAFGDPRARTSLLTVQRFRFQETVPLNDPMRILVTGGYGCIGAQTVKWLLSQTPASVIIGSRKVISEWTERLFQVDENTRLKCIALDVCDQRQMEEVRREQVQH